jgi:protein TonB
MIAMLIDVRKVLAALLLGMAVRSVLAQPAGPSSSPDTAPPCSTAGLSTLDVAFPREAVQLNLRQGSVVMEFTLTADGQVTDIHAVESSHPVFTAAATNILRKYQCRGLGRDVRVRVPFKFNLSG